MNFREIKIEDKSIIEIFKRKTPKYNCDFCFTDLYIWSSYYHTQICVLEDMLFLRYFINQSYLYFIPLGNTSKGIEFLITYTRQQNEPLRIINIEEQDISMFSSSDFIIEHKPNNDDYIYSAVDLSLLQGKKYKAKRNFANYFKDNYSYEIIPLSEFNEQEDLQFLDLWNKDNPEEDKHSFLGEREAILKSFHHMNSLDLDGIILKVDNQVVGITIGTFWENTFITHFEKVDYAYRGASQMINYLMANYVKNKVEFINREEDLGIEGLKIAKSSYHPIRKIRSYTAYYLKDFPEKHL